MHRLVRPACVGHRGAMAIRMREWGLKAYPNQAVQVPLSGINGMAESARALGRGIAELGAAGSEFAALYDRVQQQGEQTHLSEVIEQAAGRAQEKLSSGQSIENWSESWHKEVAPAVEQALSEVPESRRDQARQTAEKLIHRASLEAQRRYELQRVADSRHRWQQRVDEAVQRGNTAEAEARLEEGRGVFVPAGEMDDRRRSLRSRCNAARWKQDLQQDPLSALGEWNSGAARPEGEADVEQVQQEMSLAQRELKRRLGAEFADGLLRGESPSRASVEGAARAGLIELSERRLRGERTGLSPENEAAWMRRADACATEDEDAVADLRLQVATMNSDVAQRRRLLQYFDEGRALPAEERRRISTDVWNLYSMGKLGCCGDPVALQRAARLMREGRRALAEEAEDKGSLNRWLGSLKDREPSWVCFEQA